MRNILCIAAVLASCLCNVAVAGVKLFDFETDAEYKANPDRGTVVAVTNCMATSGDFALHVKGGGWSAFYLFPKVKDWRDFDRFSVDVVNLRGGTNFCGRVRIFMRLPGQTDDEKAIERRFYIRSRGHFQGLFPIGNIPANLRAKIEQIHVVFEGFQNGLDLYFDNFTLLKKGEVAPTPEGPCVGRDILPLLSSEKDSFEAKVAAIEPEFVHLKDYVGFCRMSMGSPCANAKMAVGWTTSREKVMPRGAFSAKAVPEEGLSLRLARNEYESVQLLVAPLGDDLRKVKARAEGDFAANISCDVIGYVLATNDVGYTVGKTVPADNEVGYKRVGRVPPKGWWPDPILDFMDEVDVKGTDVQSFWVRVRCPEDQKPGTWRNTLVVSAEGADDVRIPLTVRVNDFTLPRTSMLPLSVTFMPETPCQNWKGHNKPLIAWWRHRAEWGEFLADYLITMQTVYHAGDKVYFDVLEKLRDERRLGMFCIGYLTHPASTNDADVAKWRASSRLVNLTNNYERARQLGIADRAYVYGWDEEVPRDFPMMKIALEHLRSILPGVPYLTTARDHNYGCGTLLSGVDGFIPGSYEYNASQAARARKEGRKVWWYVCCGPTFPYTNMFTECPGTETRLLMGAQAVRMRPDGFLYYQLSYWNSERVIDSGPFVDYWNPDSQNTRSVNGDGILAYTGPDGRPIPCIRLENFRDGLEDYAYAKLLEEKLRVVESSKLKVESDGDEPAENSSLVTRNSSLAEWA
ncbi:MAG: DUF4091 domain-containing protein, partial [Kiritimatiellae bacterium]|nr:DUF4091 domain-containing protein [Kiritimatiellia bacterium]